MQALFESHYIYNSPTYKNELILKIMQAISVRFLFYNFYHETYACGIFAKGASAYGC
jgi:hypothetical protein